MATHLHSSSMTREQGEPLLRHIFQTADFPNFARFFLKIKTKEQGVQPFVLWPHQVQMWQDRADLIASNKPLWRFYLKYRQGGFSRYFLAEDLFFALTHPNTNVLIVAHKKKLPTQFLKDIKGFIASMPVWCRPELAEDTATSIQFTDEFGGSRITIASANTAMEGGGLEVGETYQRIHVSEASDPVFKKDPLNEMFQTAPPNSEVIVESTAKGIGNWHHETYWSADRGESKFTSYFVSWTVHDEYRADVPLDFRPDDEELAMMEEYGLIPGQVQWRRDKIHKEMHDPQKFKEQYPLTDVEAFLFTGSSLFKLPILAHFLESEEFCKDWPTETGALDVDADGKPFFVPAPNGSLAVYRRPEEDVTYCVTGDVAEGLEDGDYSVAEVFRGDTMEQCAEWRGHVPPRDFAYVMANLGHWYNDAIAAPEDNGMGSTTCDVMFEHLNYPNLYYRERPGPVPSISYKRIGWHTGSNKPDMCEELAHQIRDHEQTGFRPHSEVMVNECRTFAANLDKQGKDRYAAQSGCHDDTVMAVCINLGVINSCQYVTISTNEGESFHQMAVDAGVIPDTKPRYAWDEETEEDNELANWCHR